MATPPPLPPPKRKRGRPRKVVIDPGELLQIAAQAETEGLLAQQYAEARERVPAEHREAAVFEGDMPNPDPVVLTSVERVELNAILREFGRREKEALKLFEPMPEQERFFASHAGERIAIGGNRGGKTTATCVEIARALTGQDPFGKYPATSGRAILVGKDLTHCAKVFYRKLFLPGAFKIIRDEATGKWRAFRPNDPADEARIDEAEPAPPLVSHRFYDYRKISWENKKEQTPKTITLKNGWEAYFFSSLGLPPQGWDVDLVAFDEEIEHPLWYPEMSARLLDRRKKSRSSGKVQSGKFVWSATPQAGTEQLYDLKRRADEQLHEAEPQIVSCHFGLLDNAFLAEDAKADFVRKLEGNEDEYRVRVLGEFALVGFRVYGEFTPRGVHGCDSFPVPDDWTRYVAIDPGRQVCAVLFCAVPPPGKDVYVTSKDGLEVNLGRNRAFLYDELYIKKANAEIVGRTIAKRLGTQRITLWVIDHRAGRITEIGSGITHEEQYRRAFIRHKIFGPRERSGFAWSTASGGDDVKAGIEAVRLGLHVGPEGHSRWCVFRDKCKQLIREAELYSYRRLPSGLVTDEVIKANDHLMDCWRYLACVNLKWSKAQPKKREIGYTGRIIARKKEKARKSAGWSGSIKLG